MKQLFVSFLLFSLMLLSNGINAQTLLRSTHTPRHGDTMKRTQLLSLSTVNSDNNSVWDLTQLENNGKTMRQRYRQPSDTIPIIGAVEYEKLSIVEALAHAGDLTIYGRRDNILLIREDATGEKHQHRLNLNDANLINSPYYYLQQNDIVYVEPNKAKAKTSDISQSTTIWFSIISIVTSIASLIVNITR